VLYPVAMATSWGVWSPAARETAEVAPEAALGRRLAARTALPPEQVAALIVWLAAAPAELVLNEAVVSSLEEQGWPQLGSHPLLATRADTGEVLHARQRTGRAASGRGGERFVNQTAGRVRRAGASGQVTLRADSGLWAAKVLAACRRHGIRCSIPVPQISTVTAASPRSAGIPGPTLTTPTAAKPRSARPPRRRPALVRRTRLTGPRPRCGRTGATTPWSPTVKAAR
jgi:hypothetical protein